MIEVALTAGALAGAASAAHCFAMCGPLSFFATGASGSPALRHLRYQLGRAMAYMLAGAVAGTSLGSIAGFIAPRWASMILAIVLAIAMALAAWRLVAPAAPALVRISRRAPRTPLAARLLSRLPREPLLLGAMCALLPCGALYTAILIAAGTGSALSGALAMCAFAFTSGVGLGVFAWVGKRVQSSEIGRWVLATALTLGALFVLLRPILTDDALPCCRALTG